MNTERLTHEAMIKTVEIEIRRSRDRVSVARADIAKATLTLGTEKATLQGWIDYLSELRT